MQKILVTVTLILLSWNLSAAKPKDSDTVSLSRVENDWYILFTVPNFRFIKTRLSPDGEVSNWQFTNKKNEITMDISFEKAPRKGNSANCRDYYAAKLKEEDYVDKETIKYFKKNQFECCEYFFQNEYNPRYYKGFILCLSLDDSWVNISFTKTNFQPADTMWFDEIVKGITIVTNYKYAIHECALTAANFFFSENYSMAKRYYERALSVDKIKHRLEKESLISLIDNLGICYAITGDIDTALAMLEYGKNMFPTYPRFYYSIAYCYVEKSDMEHALENLLLAAKYKKNAFPYPMPEDFNRDNIDLLKDAARFNLPGGTMVNLLKYIGFTPNTMVDKSFKKYMNDDKFRKAMEEYKK
jgi:tetratricopeptide (TPR) repeat protein